MSMVMITIALLGLSGLMATGIGQTQQAFNESQAIFLMQDLANRMKANIEGVNGNHYLRNNIDSETILSASSIVEESSAVKNCLLELCNPDEIATFDINEWLLEFKTLLALSSEDESLQASICQTDSNGNCSSEDPRAAWRISMSWGGTNLRNVSMSKYTNTG